jgi:hypothetical protein
MSSGISLYNPVSFQFHAGIKLANSWHFSGFMLALRPLHLSGKPVIGLEKETANGL